MSEQSGSEVIFFLVVGPSPDGSLRIVMVLFCDLERGRGVARLGVHMKATSALSSLVATTFCLDRLHILQQLFTISNACHLKGQIAVELLCFIVGIAPRETREKYALKMDKADRNISKDATDMRQ